MAKEPEASIMKLLIDVYQTGMHYIGLLLFAVVGGIVNYVGRLQRGETTMSWKSFFADVLISGFAGILAALLAKGMGIEGELVYFLVGISGHLGTRAIFLMQVGVTKRLEDLKLLPKDKK